MGNVHLSTEKMKAHQSTPELLERGGTMAVDSFEICTGWLGMALGRKRAWLGGGGTHRATFLLTIGSKIHFCGMSRLAVAE